jgi:hypothetical protein
MFKKWLGTQKAHWAHFRESWGTLLEVTGGKLMT